MAAVQPIHLQFQHPIMLENKKKQFRVNRKLCYIGFIILVQPRLASPRHDFNSCLLEIGKKLIGLRVEKLKSLNKQKELRLASSN